MMKKYRQGIYKPKNKDKCITEVCIYRSGLELSFMKWCDNNSNVLKWASESIIIPYLNPLDNKVHKYFIDNYVVLKDSNNIVHKYIVEIKPSNQTIPPKKSNKKNPKTILREQRTYVVNSAKWTFASRWAEKNGYKFLIITEKDLKQIK